MVSLVLTLIAFAGAMGFPAFLTAIVESAVRPSTWGTGASRRTNWTDRHRPAAIVIKRTSIGQSLTYGRSVRWTPFRAKDGPHYERREALTTMEKKSNGKRSPSFATTKEAAAASMLTIETLEGIAHQAECPAQGLRHRKQRKASAINRRTKKAPAIPLRQCSRHGTTGARPLRQFGPLRFWAEPQS